MAELKKDRHRNEITVGATNGGCLILFGLVFAGIGAFFTYLTVTDPSSVTINNRPATKDDWWFGCIFVFAGLLVAGIRSRTRIDLNNRVLHKFIGLYFWGKRTETALGDVEQVRLSRVVRGNGKNRRTVYPVSLRTSTGDYEIVASSLEKAARENGELLAKAFQCDLNDTRDGTFNIRKAHELDSSVKERAHLETPIIEAPPGSRITIEEGISKVTITAKASGTKVIRFAPLIVSVVIGFCFWRFFWHKAGVGFGDGDRTLFEQLFNWLPLFMFVGVPVIYFLGQFYCRVIRGTIVTVGNEYVCFNRARFRKSEIEEMVVTTRPLALRVSGDNAEIRVGHGMSEEELNYLRSSILQRM